MNDGLAPKMLALAASGHPRAAELTEKADAMTEAARKFHEGTGDVKKMVGTWARARKLWCEITGEPLV